jgi:hypothetical protein
VAWLKTKKEKVYENEGNVNIDIDTGSNETLGNKKDWKKVFIIYIDFCPFLGRPVIGTKKFLDMLREIDIRGIKYPDLVILLEFYNALGRLKPFFVIKSSDYKDIRVKRIDWKTAHKKGYIQFPDGIYNINEPSSAVSWNLDEYMFFYHPIQFIQFLSYFKSLSFKYLLDIKQFKKFYYDRRFKFVDRETKEWKKRILQDHDSIDEYIAGKIASGRNGTTFDYILLDQSWWLCQETFDLWIKMECLFGSRFYHPRSMPSVQYRIDTSCFLNKLISFLSIDSYFQKIDDKFTTWFSLDDHEWLLKFKEKIRMNIYYGYDGLEDFSDLISLVKDEKLKRFKGYNNLFVNLHSILRTIHYMENEFKDNYPGIGIDTKEGIERPLRHPAFPRIPDSKKEQFKEIDRILLEYGLVPDSKYKLIVEGGTESIIIEPFIELMYNRYDVPLTINPKGGINEIMHYARVMDETDKPLFFLDFDNLKDYNKNRKDIEKEFKKIGIDTRYYRFFTPDFVTENFDDEDICSAVKFFVERNNEQFSKIERSKLENELRNKSNNQGYEEIVENFLKETYKDEHYIRFSKTEFARDLRRVFIDTFHEKKRIFASLIEDFILEIVNA